MKKYQRILAAIDFSRYSGDVMDHAVSMARKMDSELILMNVINQRDIDMIEYTFEKLKSLTDKLTLTSLTDKLYREREKKMNDLVAQFDTSGIKKRFLIRTGVPYQQALAAVTEFNIDLVFIGEKGRSDLVDTLIGSMAQKMVRHCPVSTFIVRQRKGSKDS